MVMRAEARALISQSHVEITTAQKSTEERELSKFRFLNEIFLMGKQHLEQRKSQLETAEEALPEGLLGGLGDALEEVGRLLRQSEKGIYRHEGAIQAFLTLEKAFQQEVIEATSRARGLVVQGERAVELASRTSEKPTHTEAPEPSPEAPQVLMASSNAEDSAKEPMGHPKQMAERE